MASNRAHVLIKTILVRKVRGKHLIKSISLEKKLRALFLVSAMLKIEYAMQLPLPNCACKNDFTSSIRLNRIKQYLPGAVSRNPVYNFIQSNTSSIHKFSLMVFEKP